MTQILKITFRIFHNNVYCDSKAIINLSLSSFAFNILCSSLLQHIDLASETLLMSYIRGSSKGETRRFIFSKNIKKNCEAITVNFLLISKLAEKNTHIPLIVIFLLLIVDQYSSRVILNETEPLVRGGGYSREFWIGVCREGSWTLTLFKD